MVTFAILAVLVMAFVTALAVGVFLSNEGDDWEDQNDDE